MFVVHPLAPVYDENSHTLILGTMPSPASREIGFYYMHPQNRFWQVMARIAGENLRFKNNGQLAEISTASNAACNTACVQNKTCNIADAIAERKSLVLRHGLALWDVIESCEITGASDSSIKNPVANDIGSLLAKTQVKRIFTTGQTAYKYYTKLVEPHTKIAAVCLPSTSPANAKWTLDLLVDKYATAIFTNCKSVNCHG